MVKDIEIHFLTHVLSILPSLFLFVNRDVDETKDWIDEKDDALNSDNFGHDLASVQALQRKHDAIERDLSALGEKVRDLDEAAKRLMQTHPDQAEQIYEHQRDINEQWNTLTQKVCLDTYV